MSKKVLLKGGIFPFRRKLYFTAMKFLRILFIAVFIGCCLPVFAQQKNPVSVKNPPKTKSSNLFFGIASYYHNKFHGRKMANGHIYSKIKLTAASNKIPLNRYVRVTNMKNHKMVIVKITDRMNRKNKRLIDLSLIAAQKIKMTGYGIVPVKVELLPKGYKPQ